MGAYGPLSAHALLLFGCAWNAARFIGGTVSQRRRDSGVRETVACEPSGRILAKASFVLPADGAVLHVFQQDTRIREFLANLVGSFEITVLFRGAASLLRERQAMWSSGMILPFMAIWRR